MLLSRKVISLGGWCGPALMLGKLGYRTEAYPMDFSRCTLDGIIHFIRNGFADGFYPPGPPPYKPECVGIWVLFRGQHTAFAHFDLNSEKIRKGFERKMERWDEALDGKLGPLHFFRTVTARNPREELDLIPELENALLERNPKLDFRLSVAVHDQNLSRTTLMQPLSKRAALWTIEYTADESKTLFDRAHDGYEEIVQTSVLFPEETNDWPPSPFSSSSSSRKIFWKDSGKEISLPEQAELFTLEKFPWRSHENISLIDGTASVAGTCTGIGSTSAIPTFSLADQENNNYPFKCNYCGNEKGHPAVKKKKSVDEDRPFTELEDEVLVAHLCKILVMGSDRVEAVESIAHELGRTSFEVVCRLQYLTNSSLKLTEGLADEKDEE
jgi:hypothetical protein